MRRPSTVVALAAWLAVTTAAPAHADPDRLELSIDPATPLFTSAHTYAPGDHARAFTLTNGSPARVLATIELLRPHDGQGDLAQLLEFAATVEGQAARSTWTELDGPAVADCLVIGSAYLSPRDDADVVVTMRMSAEGREGMDESAEFAFRVTLSQVTRKGKVDACGQQSSTRTVQVLGQASATTPTSPGPEADGVIRSLGLVAWLAAGLLGVGGLLAAGRRRFDPRD